MQNVCGKRFQLNLFSPVFCATFLQSFLFYPYSISTPPSSFSFQSYFLFFNSFILHFYTSTAVDTCSLRLRILCLCSVKMAYRVLQVEGRVLYCQSKPNDYKRLQKKHVMVL